MKGSLERKQAEMKVEIQIRAAKESYRKHLGEHRGVPDMNCGKCRLLQEGLSKLIPVHRGYPARSARRYMPWDQTETHERVEKLLEMAARIPVFHEPKSPRLSTMSPEVWRGEL